MVIPVLVVVVVSLVAGLPQTDDCPAGCFCDKKRVDRESNTALQVSNNTSAWRRL